MAKTWERNWQPGVAAAAARAAERTTCKSGRHPWTEENIGVKGGERYCKPCRNESRRQSYEPRPRRAKSADDLYRQLMAGSTIHPESGCFIWNGYALPGGYAQIWLPMEDGQRRKEYLHRAAWTVFTGQPIPEGHEVDHVAERGCISTVCWNVTHLEPVTKKVNLARRRK